MSKQLEVYTVSEPKFGFVIRFRNFTRGERKDKGKDAFELEEFLFDHVIQEIYRGDPEDGELVDPDDLYADEAGAIMSVVAAGFPKRPRK